MIGFKEKSLIVKIHQKRTKLDIKFCSLWFGILLTTVGYCRRMKFIATFCRILSYAAKAYVHFHSKSVQSGYWEGLRPKNRSF